MSRPDPVDVLVIGAGPSGAITSLVLAQAGLKVVCLEQGGWVDKKEHPQADKDWEWRRFDDWHIHPSVRGRDDDMAVETDDSMVLTYGAVGGATVIYTAMWPRMRPSDFRKDREHGLAPDWPIAYEDLAPYYDRSDLLMGTAGLAGDPAHPPRGPFSTPPVAPGRTCRAIARTLDRLGWHWWPFPLGVISESFDGRPGCNLCGGCTAGCWRGAMSDASVSVWPKALAAGVELRPRTRVERLETGPDGRVTGAVYVDRQTGERRFQAASVVVLAANGVGTPRLLLLSESAKHPRGLANGSDQVGRNLMHHTLVGAEYWLDDPLDTYKGTTAGLVSYEFAETDTSRGFVNGFNINLARGGGPGALAVGAFAAARAPWGTEHHRWVGRRFANGFRAYAIGDDLPQADNRVTLSPRLVDSDGIALPKVAYRPHENDWRQMRWAKARLADIGTAAGAFEVRQVDYVGADGKYRTPAWHLMGTARMGDDPETSVVNRWHQAWETPNLLVIDASVFPTGGVVNPTSTVCALALRAAENLRDRFQDIARGSTALP